MNWLAIQIPSLRDFYTCRRHLTRGSAALHARRALHDAQRLYTRQRRLIRPYGTLPAAKQLYTPEGPYTATQSPYTCRRHFTRRNSALTRCEAALHARRALHSDAVALHVPKAPYTAQQRPYTRLRRLTSSA